MRPFHSMLVAAALLLPASSTLGQPDRAADPPLPERTITIGEADPIDAWRLRPMGELIPGNPETMSTDLIPDRVTFVDRLIESADEI